MMTTRRGSAAAYSSDPIVREQLIVQHMPLVHHVIGRLAIGMPGVLDRDDLVAHGVVGLIQAIDRYDPAQGVPFAAWATIRIRGAVIDAIRALDVVNPATRQRVRAYQATASRLTSELGRFPTDDEIQEAMGLPADAYASVLEAANCSMISIEAATEDEEAPLAAVLNATASDDPAERGALLAMVGDAIRRLDERERLILSLYYVEDLTLQEIATVIGVHKTVVVRLHGRAITKLRALLEVEEPESKPSEEDIHAATTDQPAADPTPRPRLEDPGVSWPSPGVPRPAVAEPRPGVSRRYAHAGGSHLSRRGE